MGNDPLDGHFVDGGVVHFQLPPPLAPRPEDGVPRAVDQLSGDIGDGERTANIGPERTHQVVHMLSTGVRTTANVLLCAERGN